MRSILTAEIQRTLANMMSQQAVKLGFANSSDLDVDSTVQDASIAILASRVGRGINVLCHSGARSYRVGLTNVKQIASYYFTLKRNKAEEGVLQSVATDKGYYSFNNEQTLIQMGVAHIHLPRPERKLDARPETIPCPIRRLLHNRRAGIESLIGHTKQGGQMGRRRMKSDETTKSAGYAAVFGFNLRQLARYIAGEVRPKIVEMSNISAKNAEMDKKMAIGSL